MSDRAGGAMGSGAHTASDGLDIPDEDPGFERWDWRAQQAGWVLIAAVVVAAPAGLFGPGVLSHASVQSADGSLQVNYTRYVRNGGVGDITVELRGDAIAGDEIHLLVDRGYLGQVKVDSISPEPVEQHVEGDSVRVVIPLTSPTEPVLVELSLTPDAMGLAHGSGGVAGGATVQFTQFMFP